MNIIQEIENLYHSIKGDGTNTQPQPKDTTMSFREVLQTGVADAEAALAKIEAVYNEAVAKVNAAKAELSILEADFSAILDKDEAAVKAFYEKLAAHFQSTPAVAPVVDPAPAVAPAVAPTVSAS
jgi:hypothetical protein